jgi:stage II sporulation protein D
MNQVGSRPAISSRGSTGPLVVRRSTIRGARVLLVLVLASIATATQWMPSLPGTSVPAAAQRKVPGALVAPVRLIPTTRDPLTIGDHGYWGSLELRPAGDGLVAVNRLSLERYLLGLQEVPLTWPDEALKAQAVAARTYALNTLSRPRAGAAATYGFDICASVECQVYSGADVLGSLGGVRWLQAVRETAGQTVLYRNEPILARYHSTSGGATLDNAQVFTGEPDYPYLQGVASTSEQTSPLYRWRVEFPLRRVEAILRRAGWWSGQGRLRAVRSVESGDGRHYPDLVFRGRKGRLVRTAEEFRAIARTLAPAIWPKRYPSAWSTRSGRLPETLPSNRLVVSTRGGAALFHGRGWGHGVGMSQWGAEGMARRGASFEEILKYYYTGVEVAEYEGPGRISVGLDWGESQIEVSGAFSIVDGRGRTIIEEALGEWTFIYSALDVVALDPPKGFGLPLRVGIVRAPETVAPGARARVTIALSRPARIRATTDGTASKGQAAVAEAGRHEVEWQAPDEPGSYRVRVEATAGSASRRSEVVEIAVTELSRGRPAAPSGSAREQREGTPDRTWIYVLVLFVAVIALVGKWLTGRIGR